MVAIEDLPTEEEVQKGPRLMLRVATQPIEDSSGVRMTPFAPGEEIAVVNLEQVKGWEPLRWRFEQSARERSIAEPTRPATWPEGPRCGAQRRCWLAHIFSADGKGGINQHVCLLQVMVDKAERKIENFQLDLEDAKSAAAHAHRFNLHLARTLGGDANASAMDAMDGDVPSIKVCAPMGCYVVGGTAASVAAPGDVISITPYTASEVRKFVFDGREEFQEVPHAFFHYTACQTGGNQYVCDIQGSEEDDGSFLLVDPVLLRAPKPGIGDLLGAIVPGSQATGGSNKGPSSELFNQFHPRCGGLCKAFDPQRRSAAQRRHCGIGVSCGVGGA